MCLDPTGYKVKIAFTTSPASETTAELSYVSPGVDFFSWSPNGRYIVLFAESVTIEESKPVILDLETREIIKN